MSELLHSNFFKIIKISVKHNVKRGLIHDNNQEENNQEQNSTSIYGVFEGYLEVYQIKDKKIVFILFKPLECLNSIKNYLSIPSALKPRKPESLL